MRWVLLSLCLILAGCEKPAQVPASMDASGNHLECRGENIEVLAFTAKYCGPCQDDKAELAKLRAKGLNIREIDVDADPDTADEYNITHLPTYVVEQDGVEIKRTKDVTLLSAFLIGMLFWMFC